MAGRNQRRRPRQRQTASNVATGSGDTNTAPRRTSGGGGGRGGGGGGGNRSQGGFSWNGRGGHSISFADHLRNVARKKLDRNPLYDPSQQLGGANLSDAADSLTALQFDPQEQALRQALADATTQGTALVDRAKGYSDQLAAVDAGIPGQQQQVAGQLNTAIANNAGSASASIQAAIDAATKRRQEDQAIRGGIGAADVAARPDEGAAQLARVAEQRAAAQTAADSSNANWQNLANLAAAARRQQGGETQRDLLTRLANAQTSIRGQQTQLATDRGNARVKNLTDLRQQAFENLITQQGLGIKASDIASTAATAEAKLKSSENQAQLDRQSRERIARENRAARVTADREARSGKANDVNQYGYTNAQWLRLSINERKKVIEHFKTLKGPSATGGGGQPTAAAQKLVTDIEQGWTDTQTDKVLQRHVHESGPRLTQILVKRGMPPLQAQATAELARYGYVMPTTQKALERAGVKVPREWLGLHGGNAQANYPTH